ncbi:VOC family protein [Leptothrix discophora]|uniref:VOC family protein n=1 Tax=Leptothrix discophora TaxID=89 RepID=A0ABT9FZS4_LEPDI|nr:VOC family protein [Leptothrix discophora]MDP4299719.1 VOC family protein [Leptothrix discophora]
MHYAYTIVYVQDPEASLSFDERAFGLERRFISPDGDDGELQTGGTTLSFARHALARAVEAGGTVLKPPTVKPWGLTVAYLRCPDGSLVELCTPVGG